MTCFYVRLTNKLVRRQDIGQKREIVEKLYKPLTADLSEQASKGFGPDMRIWSRFKGEEPFLANHHLIPPELRSLLDKLEDEVPDTEEAYEAVVQGVRALAVTELNLPEGTPTDDLQLIIDWTVTGRFGDQRGCMTQRWSLVLDGRSFDEKSSYYGSESASSITFHDQAIKVEEVYVERFNDLIAKDERTSERLDEYREYMHRAIMASQQIDREIRSASRV